MSAEELEGAAELLEECIKHDREALLRHKTRNLRYAAVLNTVTLLEKEKVDTFNNAKTALRRMPKVFVVEEKTQEDNKKDPETPKETQKQNKADDTGKTNKTENGKSKWKLDRKSFHRNRSLKRKWAESERGNRDRGNQGYQQDNRGGRAQGGRKGHNNDHDELHNIKYRRGVNGGERGGVNIFL